MAERTAAPSGGDATGQDVLLATKLYVPRRPAGLVARPRLVEALADGQAGALVAVNIACDLGSGTPPTTPRCHKLGLIP